MVFLIAILPQFSPPTKKHYKYVMWKIVCTKFNQAALLNAQQNYMALLVYFYAEGHWKEVVSYLPTYMCSYPRKFVIFPVCRCLLILILGHIFGILPSKCYTFFLGRKKRNIFLIAHFAKRLDYKDISVMPYQLSVMMLYNIYIIPLKRDFRLKNWKSGWHFFVKLSYILLC